MGEAYIIDAVRTPVGRRGGGLSEEHPADLGAHAIRGLVERTGVDPMAIDDVIMGCVMQVGEQSLNIGRNAVLTAGWPEEVPSTTVDRQCGSSQQAAHFAAQGVIAGADNIRAMIEGILAEFGAPGTTFNLMTTQTVGDVVAFTWSAETAVHVYAFASDNFVLRDGKAAYHIFAAQVQPK